MLGVVGFAAGMGVGCQAVDEGRHEARTEASTPVTVKPGRLGFAYAVPGFVGDWNAGSWQWPQVQSAFRRDVAILAALGAPAVKIFFAPDFTGLRYEANTGGHIDHAALDAARKAVVEIVATLRDHGLPVVIDFMTNEAYLRGPNGFYPNNVPNNFEYAYQAFGVEEGARRMAQDYVVWQTAIVRAVQDAGLEEAIWYYNLATEMQYNFPPAATWQVVTRETVRAVLRDVPVPAGKRSADVFLPSEALLLAADASAVGAPLAFTEVHSYPNAGYHADIAAGLDTLRATSGGATPVVGEFGSGFCQVSSEAEQTGWVLQALDTATANNAVILNWTLWDEPVGGCVGDPRYGLGFGPDDPRDVLGAVVDRVSAVPGGDFEAGTSGWTVEGAGGHLVHASSSPATGQRHLRVEAQAAGVTWACSPDFAAQGTAVAVSAYLRSSVSSVVMQLHTRDDLGWTSETGMAPLSRGLASTTTWRNVQSIAGGFVFDLPPNTDRARLCFVFDAPSQGSTLDLDTVSLRTLGEPEAVTPCPCLAGYDNFCSYPSGEAGCAMVQPGGYCDPDGNGWLEGNGDWERGWNEYHAQCPTTFPGPSCPCLAGYDNFCSYPSGEAGCAMVQPGGYCDPDGNGWMEGNGDWERGWNEYHAQCPTVAPPSSCPCLAGYDNFCSYPSSEVGCAMVQPGGYCDPDGNGWMEGNGDWERGWYAYYDACVK